MKSTLLTFFLFLFAGTILHAQLSLLPQAGFEQSRTSLNYGDGLTAFNANASLKAGLKTAYEFKGGHTPFVNFTTTPAPVFFSFNTAGTLVGSTQSSIPKFRLEAGYQFSSKAIQLSKKTPSTNATEQPVVQQSRCGSFYRSRCGQQKRMSKANTANDVWSMRLQPAVALAYVPSAGQSLVPKTDGMDYKAAAWKTAIVPSMGFEFAKGQQRLFTLNVFYTKPLAERAQTATLSSGFKAAPVMLQPTTSSWGITVGVPFSFAKATQSKKPTERKECHRNMYRRCMRVQ